MGTREVHVRALLRAMFVLVVLAVLVASAGLFYLWNNGLSAREQPGRIEAAIARRVRQVAVARRARDLVNPVQRSPEVIADGLAHFADHCATCHANDGSGNMPMGRNLFPKAPDMRLPATQQLSDGELFWIIENGIRFTGMPGWGTGTKEGEDASWRLVHFIRYLPHLTPADLQHMQALNPRSPEEIRQEIEEEKFLSGSDDQVAAPKTPHKHPGGQDE